MLSLCEQTAIAEPPANSCSDEYYELMDELKNKIKLIEEERQKLAFKPKLINDPNIDVRLTYKDGRKMRYLESQVKKLKEKNMQLLEQIDEINNANHDNHDNNEDLENPDTRLATINEDTESLKKQVNFLEEENKRLKEALSKQSQNTAPITMNGMICKPIKP